MTGLLTADSRVELLNRIASLGLYIGLANSLPPDTNDLTLANITEVTAGGYARAPVTWGTAGAVNLSTDPVQLTNTADINFPAVTENMVPAPYAFCTDKATGSSINTPVLAKGTTAATGGTFVGGTYYWVVTAINAKGETVASNEVTSLMANNGTQVLTWAAITGATGYKVYRGTVAGAESVLVASLGTVTTYTDSGAAGTSATPPAAGTAANGRIFYVWVLAEPVSALAGKPIKCPAKGLIIE